MSSTGKHRAVSIIVAALAVSTGPFERPGPRAATGVESPEPTTVRNLAIAPGQSIENALGDVKAGETFRLLVSLVGNPVGPGESVRVGLADGEAVISSKDLHAGDPDFYLPYRPSHDGGLRITLARPPGTGTKPMTVRIDWARMTVDASERAAIEAEPNDTWQQANGLELGRDVYGSADDVDYLDNEQEGRSGLDWFRFEVREEKSVLVYFQLDLLDRDVSANLRVYTVDPKTGRPEPYHKGKDPMEIVHDRERERYSKHISRTFNRGTYYLEVNANHPDYILRTRVLPVPPYDDPAKAVEAGMQYIMNVGDAWFAQVPREGNIFVRADNLHDTATRCTACHPSSFSTEANLVAHRNGFPIRSKSNFQYVIDRLYNSPAPLYGDDGLYWQRFIAIPLQAQGKQGGILLDYERRVSEEPTQCVERFAPFLLKAWETRRDLPADEVNGVIPLDSKFGFAWRDWRVLDQLARRTGRADYANAAARVASILGERAADRRIESLQDRIHRLYAWWLIDPARFANKIKRETGALIAFQNPDGGWHEVDTGPGPSAVYTTGQLAWTLLRIGLPRDHPAVARALRYLLSQQQDFGGWIQTTTHENFRTPMRETRYAVMALAGAFPLPGAPLRGWGNRDEKPARLPRTDRLIHTLDDLENLWDVPRPDRARFALAIEPLLEHREPMVRAIASACLGRLGEPSSIKPLVGRLADPSKIVWRTAAWGLRRLGNRGIGHAEIASAWEMSIRPLGPGPRIFAYQFFGMDDRPELVRPFFDLTRDPDLLTRSALRTLRQWFYRTGDPAISRRIIEVYLARMAEPDLPVVRKSLSQGLYIMLDENLGGGVSLQKNIAELPESLRPGILEARKSFERRVLLTPVLAALKDGNELQRSGVLDGFNGSFFKGRSYARQPEGMIDVGNDREFGFLSKTSVEELEAVFAPLLTAELPAASRRQAILLASFFRIPGETRNPAIQQALLDRLGDPDESVRSAACLVVGREVDLAGAENDPKRLERIASILRRGAPEREAILRVIGRNPRLADRPELMTAIRGLIEREDAAPSLLPLLRWPAIRDDDAIAIANRAWPRLVPAGRVEAIEAVLARPALDAAGEPREDVMRLLRQGVTDPSAEVRERTLRGVSTNPVLWSGQRTAALLLAALSDDSPSLKRLGLSLALTKPGFWKRSDAGEYLKRLLIDSDREIRIAALDLVGRQEWIRKDPGMARRVKSLEADGMLAKRVRSLLASQGVPPDSVLADTTLARPRLLSLSTFRDKVNPLFYQAGEDGHSCAECHGNHTILRIAPIGDAGSSRDSLIINYDSAIKVINLGDPESSLILRKPRSPHGQGVPDPSSPTGLTHVGGPRWEGTEHPAYRAILAWIRQAAAASNRPDAEARLTADSYSPDHEPGLADDGDPATFWHTEFVGGTPGYPHELIVDMGTTRKVEGLLYVPRQDSPNGRVKDFEVRVSRDGKSWGEPVARGRWENDPAYKYVALPSTIARFVQLRGLSEVEGRPFMSAAEVVVESRDAGRATP